MKPACAKNPKYPAESTTATRGREQSPSDEGEPDRSPAGSVAAECPVKLPGPGVFSSSLLCSLIRGSLIKGSRARAYYPARLHPSSRGGPANIIFSGGLDLLTPAATI